MYFSEDLVRNVGQQICFWLACEGATEFVHGNICPANFVLCEDGRVEFINMSAVEESKSSTDSQVLKNKVGNLDYAHDVQALGRLLLSMCTHVEVKNI